MNYNKVLLGARLTRDVELRFNPGGKAIANFGVATSRKWKTETGEMKEKTCFVDVSAFGKQAETVSKYFKKGSPIFIDGWLDLQEWEDKATGQKRSKLKVVMESFTFVGGKDSGQAQTEPAAAKASAPVTPNTNDDVPF